MKTVSKHAKRRYAVCSGTETGKMWQGVSTNPTVRLLAREPAMIKAVEAFEPKTPASVRCISKRSSHYVMSCLFAYPSMKKLVTSHHRSLLFLSSACYLASRLFDKGFF